MTSLIWFRYDLRVQDNPALKAALEKKEKVFLIYIFDEAPLYGWKMGSAQRWWLYHSLDRLQKKLEKENLFLNFYRGNPLDILPTLARRHNVSHIYWNRQYEPYTVNRDEALKKKLRSLGHHVESYNGSLLYEPWEVSNAIGEPYKIFTPFWQRLLSFGSPRDSFFISLKGVHSIRDDKAEKLDSWELIPKSPNWAKEWETFWTPGEDGAHKLLETFVRKSFLTYKKERDFPALEGTSRLSPHLRFGEISPHQVWRFIKTQALLAHKGIDSFNEEAFLRQLGWREFCTSILYYYPSIPEKPFRKEFENFQWEIKQEFLKCWQQGLTGHPLVDAGMRQLWQTGWMHNRVRMVVASFLTKDLFIHWIEGEKWFWETLVDADLANNACGWQWVAGCGTDAQPYFRIFNPTQQSRKFDLNGEYIRQWIPELSNLNKDFIHAPWEAGASELSKAGIQLGKTYPLPLIDHQTQRKKALFYYEEMKKR